MARADAKERERVAWVHGWLTGDDPPPDFSAACKDWGPAVLAHRGMSKPTFATTLNSNTVRSIFLAPRTVRPKLLPRGIRLGQSDPVDPCWPLPSRDNAMAAEPAYKPPSVRYRDGQRDLRQHRLLPVTATRLGCSIRSVYRWRPGRFETPLMDELFGRKTRPSCRRPSRHSWGTNKEAGPVRRLPRRERMRLSAVARPQINGPAPIPF
jgi:hypothetical protein